jgi:uncharacterized OsmC-like protein
VTQFVGYIPVGRAPDHFHKYDEVVYVLEGDGALQAALAKADEGCPFSQLLKRAGVNVQIRATLA